MYRCDGVEVVADAAAWTRRIQMPMDFVVVGIWVVVAVTSSIKVSTDIDTLMFDGTATTSNQFHQSPSTTTTSNDQDKWLTSYNWHRINGILMR
jgi:hypothetical protein